MDLVQTIGLIGLLYLAFWQGVQREGVVIYALVGAVVITFGLSWRGTYDTPAGVVFGLAIVGIGIYCLICAVVNIWRKLKG